MPRPSQTARSTPGRARNICLTTYLPASWGTNIRGTSIAKTVIFDRRIPLHGGSAHDHEDRDHRVGRRDAVERTS
jgi:hypothetical protein